MSHEHSYQDPLQIQRLYIEYFSGDCQLVQSLKLYCCSFSVHFKLLLQPHRISLLQNPFGQMSTDWQRSPFLTDAGIKNKCCWRPDTYQETKNTGETQSLVFLFVIKSENQT